MSSDRFSDLVARMSAFEIDDRAAFENALKEAALQHAKMKRILGNRNRAPDTLDKLQKSLDETIKLLRDNTNSYNLLSVTNFDDPDGWLLKQIAQLRELRDFAARGHLRRPRGQAARQRTELYVLARVLARHWRSWGKPVEQSWKRGGFGDFVREVVKIVDPAAVSHVNTVVKNVVSENKAKFH